MLFCEFVRRKYFLIWFGGNFVAWGATSPFRHVIYDLMKNLELWPSSVQWSRISDGRFYFDNDYREWPEQRNGPIHVNHLWESVHSGPSQLTSLEWKVEPLMRRPTLNFHKCENVSAHCTELVDSQRTQKKLVYCSAEWVGSWNAIIIIMQQQPKSERKKSVGTFNAVANPFEHLKSGKCHEYIYCLFLHRSFYRRSHCWWLRRRYRCWLFFVFFFGSFLLRVFQIFIADCKIVHNFMYWMVAFSN